MRHTAVILILAASVFSAGVSARQNQPAQTAPAPTAAVKTPPASPAPTETVLFSPRDKVTDAIIARINAAQTTVRVLAYSFTSERIANALLAAHKRGVDVQVIVDKSQRRAVGSRAYALASGGMPVFVDSKHAIQHNKIIVLDSKTVLTGSFNFTKAAEEKNAENMVIIEDASLAEKYTAEWQIHRDHSDPLDAVKKSDKKQTVVKPEESAP